MERTFSGSEDECMNLEKDLQHFGPLCTQPLCAPKVMSTRGKFESQVFHGALIASLSTFPLLGAEVSGSCQIRLMTGDDLDALVSVENVCFVQPYSREPGQKNTK